MTIVWASDFTGRQSDLQHYYTATEAFSKQLPNYPNGGTVEGEETLLALEEELKQLQTEIISAIGEYSYRPKEREKLVDLAISEAAKYRVWLNYQRYLFHSQGKEAPMSLQAKAYAKSSNELTKHIEALIDGLSDRRITTTKDNWVFGINPDTPVGLWSHKFNRSLFDLHREIRWQLSNHYSKQGGLPSNIDLSLTTLPTIPGARITRENNLIKVEITEGPIKNEFMVIAVYSKPYRKNPYTRKQTYILAIEPIYISFPGKYLSGEWSPIKPSSPD